MPTWVVINGEDVELMASSVTFEEIVFHAGFDPSTPGLEVSYESPTTGVDGLLSSGGILFGVVGTRFIVKCSHR